MSETQWDLQICCMGAGYVGGPTMAVIAKMCPKVRACFGAFVCSFLQYRWCCWYTYSLTVNDPR